MIPQISQIAQIFFVNGSLSYAQFLSLTTFNVRFQNTHDKSANVVQERNEESKHSSWT